MKILYNEPYGSINYSVPTIILKDKFFRKSNDETYATLLILIYNNTSHIFSFTDSESKKQYLNLLINAYNGLIKFIDRNKYN